MQTDYQKAQAAEAAAYGAVRDAEQALDQAHRELDWARQEAASGYRDDINAEQRLAEAAEALTNARVAHIESARALTAATRYTRKQFADRLGIAPDTLSGYISRGHAPAPDSQPGDLGHPWWYGSTVEAYANRDKRPGSRTDLQRCTRQGGCKCVMGMTLLWA